MLKWHTKTTTSRTGLPRQNCQERTNRQRQPGHESGENYSQNGTVGTLLPLRDNQDGIVSTEPPRTRLSGGKSQNRTRTGQPGQAKQENISILREGFYRQESTCKQASLFCFRR